MRKYMKSFGLLAVAAVAVLACNKVEVKPMEEANGTHAITFILNQPETKTSIVEGDATDTFLWSDDDAARFLVWENDDKASDVALDIATGNETMAITATFSGTASSPFTYKAVMAKNVDGSDKPVVPASQKTAAGSYDPDADILVAKPVTEDDQPATLSMQFQRPVVINKMTLTELTAGEVVTEVQITSDKEITGTYDPDNVTGHWSAGEKTIVLGTSEEIAVSSEGSASVYFVSMPVDDAMLTVTVYTNAARYEKTFTKAINLMEDMVTYFSVGGWTKTAKTAVTLSFPSASESYYTTDSGSSVGQTATADPDVPEVTGAITYAISGDAIYSDFDTTTGQATLNGAVGTATITASFAGDDTYSAATDQSYTITVSKVDVTISAFASSSQTAYTGDTEDSDIAAFVDWDSFTGQTTTVDQSVTLTYEMFGDAIGSIAADGSVTLNGTAGSATVTASFAGDDIYNAATSQSYTITVKTLKKSTLAIAQAVTSNTTLTSADGKEWSLSANPDNWVEVKGKPGQSPDYVQVGAEKKGPQAGSNSKSLSLESSSFTEIKRISADAAGLSGDSNSLTMKIYVGSNLLGTSGTLSNKIEGPDSGWTTFSCDNDDNDSGNAIIEISRPEALTGSIWFKTLFVVFAE
jgi:hypothetical protein